MTLFVVWSGLVIPRMVIQLINNLNLKQYNRIPDGTYDMYFCLFISDSSLTKSQVLNPWLGHKIGFRYACN